MTHGKSLDELKDAYDRGLPAGTENLAEATSIGFQYRVAKTQERWARISAMIAGAGVVIALAAVVVAAVK